MLLLHDIFWNKSTRMDSLIKRFEGLKCCSFVEQLQMLSHMQPNLKSDKINMILKLKFQPLEFMWHFFSEHDITFVTIRSQQTRHERVVKTEQEVVEVLYSF